MCVCACVCMFVLLCWQTTACSTAFSLWSLLSYFNPSDLPLPTHSHPSISPFSPFHLHHSIAPPPHSSTIFPMSPLTS